MSLDFYNNYATIASHIDSINIKSEFKTTLKEYYANRIIKEGYTVDDTKAEKTKLNSIPSNGTLIKFDGKQTLYDMVKSVYTGVDELSSVQQKKVFDYLADINPGVFLGASLIMGQENTSHLRQDKTHTKLTVSEQNKTFVYSFNKSYDTILIPNTNILSTIANK
jgi:hypothetical protein